MPPENKPIICNLSEMTCENCVYSAHSNLLRDLECRNPDGSFTKIEIGFFCSKGLWRVVIAVGRPSVVDFQVAYDYLSE